MQMEYLWFIDFRKDFQFEIDKWLSRAQIKNFYSHFCQFCARFVKRNPERFTSLAYWDFFANVTRQFINIKTIVANITFLRQTVANTQLSCLASLTKPKHWLSFIATLVRFRNPSNIKITLLGTKITQMCFGSHLSGLHGFPNKNSQNSTYVWYYRHQTKIERSQI